MKLKVVVAVVVALAAFVSPRPAKLSAQLLPGMGRAVPGEDAVSVGLLFGQMAPQTRFRDGGRFDDSVLFGMNVTFWLHRHAGLQLNSFGTKHAGLPASDGRSSVVSERDPRIWTTVGDAVIRFPVTDGGVALAPYAAAGGGWKTYRWRFDPQAGPDARGFDLAWSYAVGMDARFGGERRIGLRGEYRDVRTPIERWGENLTHQDRVLVLGLLMNF